MKLPFNEQFLQFVWQYQYFAHQGLKTTQGLAIEIIEKGYKNSDEGPDFALAKIKVDNLIWVGSVEIHLATSGWLQHSHQHHPAYNNVILHVVYEHDEGINTITKQGNTIPVLALKGLISNELIVKGNLLFQNIGIVPCSNFVKEIEPIVFNATLARTLSHRLQRKSELLLATLENNLNDWEETTYQLIAQHFGMKVNNEAFARLAENLPLKLLLKTSENLVTTEALLFGMAGFLEYEIQDDYHQKLKKEYIFLKHKYGLDRQLQLEEWKHLRLRPYNFPELRIAQLAALYYKNGQLHAKLIDLQSINDIKSIFKSPISHYWHSSYGFGKSFENHTKGLGDLALDNLLINVVATLLVAFSKYRNDNSYLERAVELLESIHAENNKITRIWQEYGKKPANAFDSQAMIELFNTFCINKACLSCQIGVKILDR